MSTIKTVDRPSVYLVGRQVVDEDSLAAFFEDEGVGGWETDTEVGGEKLVEVAGRICYQSFSKPRPGGNAAYVGHILEVGHGSVLEHAVFNLIISGVSRSFTHELVRHRAGFGYSQLSQRFVDESGCSFVPPPGLDDEVKAALVFFEKYRERYSLDDLSDAYDRATLGPEEATDSQAKKIMVGLRWLRSMENAQADYAYFSDYGMAKNTEIRDSTLRRKKAREAARSVLPNATETQIFVTANARALRHFVEMRGDAAADAEIRRVAVEMLTVLKAEAPNLFGDYAVDPANDNAVSTAHRKV